VVFRYLASFVAARKGGRSSDPLSPVLARAAAEMPPRVLVWADGVGGARDGKLGSAAGMRRGSRTDRVDRNRLRTRSDAAAYVIQFFVFLLVAHFQPFSRSRITALRLAYQPSEKSLGKPWERLVRYVLAIFWQCKNQRPRNLHGRLGKGAGSCRTGTTPVKQRPAPCRTWRNASLLQTERRFGTV